MLMNMNRRSSLKFHYNSYFRSVDKGKGGGFIHGPIGNVSLWI